MSTDNFSNPFRGRIIPDDPNPVPPQQQAFKKRSRKMFFTILGSIAVFLVAGILAGKPTYTAFKRWRAAGFMEKSKVLVQQQKWAEAFALMQSAYVLVPDDVNNLRVIAETFTTLRSERSIDFWKRVVRSQPQSQADRRKLVQAALLHKQLRLAEVEASSLLSLDANNRENIVLAAAVARAQNDYVREVELLRRLTTQAPEDPDVSFALDRALLRMGLPKEMRESRDRLLRLAEGTDQRSLDALMALAEVTTSRYESLDLGIRIKSHPKLRPENLLRAYELEIFADPNVRDQRMQELVINAKNLDVRSLAVVASWLQERLEFVQILALLPLEKARQDDTLLFIRLDALSYLGLVEETDEVLTEFKTAIRKPLQHFARWQSRRKSSAGAGESRDAQAALDTAMNDSGTLAFLAKRFESLREDEFALVAYRRLQNTLTMQSFAVSGQLRILQRAGQSLETYKLLLALSKNDDSLAIRSDLIYFKLLLGGEVASAMADARELMIANPSWISVRVGYAFGCLQSGEPEAAMKVFDEMQGFDYRRATPRAQLVYASCLHATGRKEELAKILETIVASELLPEEQELLKSIKI